MERTSQKKSHTRQGIRDLKGNIAITRRAVTRRNHLPATAPPLCPYSFPTSGRSPQAPPRHMKRFVYRCSLPGLTGFARLHCAGPRHYGPTLKRILDRIYKRTGQGAADFMAESERVELSVQCSPYTRFPGVLLQPLGQLSKS